jgi:hypothetical protein
MEVAGGHRTGPLLGRQAAGGSQASRWATAAATGTPSGPWLSASTSARRGHHPAQKVPRCATRRPSLLQLPRGVAVCLAARLTRRPSSQCGDGPLPPRTAERLATTLSGSAAAASRHVPGQDGTFLGFLGNRQHSQLLVRTASCCRQQRVEQRLCTLLDRFRRV